MLWTSKDFNKNKKADRAAGKIQKSPNHNKGQDKNKECEQLKNKKDQSIQ